MEQGLMVKQQRCKRFKMHSALMDKRFLGNNRTEQLVVDILHRQRVQFFKLSLETLLLMTLAVCLNLKVNTLLL